MKNLIFLVFLAGISLTFNACSPGYVSAEPTYLDGPRPARPSVNHIWVDGDWEYSRHTRAYSRREGNWMVPQPGRKLVQGHWKTNQRGHSWVRNQWR